MPARLTAPAAASRKSTKARRAGGSTRRASKRVASVGLTPLDLGAGLPDPENSPFSPIPEALAELRRGRPIVVVDDSDRENEGDLVFAAEKVTPEVLAFTIKKASGLVCLALTEETCDRLLLPPQTQQNTSRFGTAFTVSIEARRGVTTGISAQDRARTILTAIDSQCRPEDLARPGHIHPLRARNGGVLVRAGHTEGGVDLCRLAGLTPAAVICEILNENGETAKLSQLELFAAEHKLKLVSIEDLIEYRRAHEQLVQHLLDVDLPTHAGPFRLHIYQSKIGTEQHLALTVGGLKPGAVQREPVLVRVHSECFTGDALGSLRCDCGEQLHSAMSAIAKAGKGVVLYMRQEGRGIGLLNKLRAYQLQEQGADTVEANKALGFKADLRRYGLGAQILYDLGVRKLRLLTNNPRKIVGLGSFGLEVVERVALRVPARPENKRYLKAKKEKLGHFLDDI